MPARSSETSPRAALVGRLRGSVLLLGPLLARRGRARLAPPGGDFPARRTIATHLDALRAMGARELEGDGHALEAPDGLRRRVDVPRRGVGDRHRDGAARRGRRATGATEIRHAACEPHVVELCQFLREDGRRRRPATARSTIRVEGRRGCAAPRTSCGGDYIEAGSWAVVAAVTGGEIDDRGRARGGHGSRRVGAASGCTSRCALEDDRFRVEPSTPVGGAPHHDRAVAGIPERPVSLVTVLATQAEGRTLVHDWMYELRLFALEQLSGMGADLFLCDPHRIIVTGPTRLRGRTLDSRDLRSGMALIAAALAADGQSRARPARDRRARLRATCVEHLQALGAQVESDGCSLERR